MSDETPGGLENVVVSFGEIFYRLGKFSFNQECKPEEIVEAVSLYVQEKSRYKGDTQVFDYQINSTLDTYPDLENVPRVKYSS